uniref:Uncharacterized protein n=1 Tax=Noctiluca scintillans TaxID=2966 RepID=A0A7S1EXG8_NOCSC
MFHCVQGLVLLVLSSLQFADYCSGDITRTYDCEQYQPDCAYNKMLNCRYYYTYCEESEEDLLECFVADSREAFSGRLDIRLLHHSDCIRCAILTDDRNDVQAFDKYWLLNESDRETDKWRCTDESDSCFATTLDWDTLVCECSDAGDLQTTCTSRHLTAKWEDLLLRHRSLDDAGTSNQTNTVSADGPTTNTTTSTTFTRTSSTTTATTTTTMTTTGTTLTSTATSTTTLTTTMTMTATPTHATTGNNTTILSLNGTHATTTTTSSTTPSTAEEGDGSAGPLLCDRRGDPGLCEQSCSWAPSNPPAYYFSDSQCSQQGSYVYRVCVLYSYLTVCVWIVLTILAQSLRLTTKPESWFFNPRSPDENYVWRFFRLLGP